MDFQAFQGLVKQIKVGKQLPDAVYVHESALTLVPEQLQSLLQRILKGLKVKEGSWNLVKFSKRDFRLTLLHYPDFDTYAYPALALSTTIDLSHLQVRKADYSSSDNPPILHRKETFVGQTYPLYDQFKAITEEGEQAGLFEKPRNIGFRKNWERLIRTKSLALDDQGRLIGEPQANDIATDDIQVHRHLTAIERHKLSAPFQLLAKYGYLEGQYSVLDYGCGKGDDYRELEAHGLDVSAWDPVYHPEGELNPSDIVNLGFVINVIEDRKERDATLAAAFQKTSKLLIVSAMVAGEAVIAQFTPYKDGIVTSRNTFQKYYSQAELKEYIASVLDITPVALGQGIFAVFKDAIAEQEFLLERQHYNRAWKQQTTKPLSTPSTVLTDTKFEANKTLFEHFWQTCLDLGRAPANTEFEFSDRIRSIAGSHKKAFDALLERYGESTYKQAKRARKEDLLVYFSLGLFDKRKAYSAMPERLKRDIKAFFGSHARAIDLATDLLFSLGNPQLIEETCLESYERIGVGTVNEGHSYIFPQERLGDVTPELRAYVGCAMQIFGDIEGFQEIKAHFTSSKVSFMRYDGWHQQQPTLKERIKVNLRAADVDYFDHSNEFSALN